VADSVRAIEYVAQRSCPACGSDSTYNRAEGRIALDAYYWGNCRIPAYQGGEHVSVLRCHSCGLLYKNLAASAESLKALFAQASDTAWKSHYAYAPEVEIVRRHFAGRKIDVLEIGAGQGGFLRAVAASARRLSALDIVRFAECERVVDGEYIIGLVDAGKLEWSGEPYELVAMFDVAEHLYDVRQGFANLGRLVRRGGLVLIETGNTESYWPRRYGPQNWWYLNLLDHHVAFTPDSLARAAKSAGFEVISIQSKRHKERQASPRLLLIKDFVKSVLYRLMPSGYRHVMACFGFAAIQPMAPFARDHFQAVLRRV
jgi:ubiquinone/menaquinone biosynthesis C-methylase UbiE